MSRSLHEACQGMLQRTYAIGGAGSEQAIDEAPDVI